MSDFLFSEEREISTFLRFLVFDSLGTFYKHK